jgi:modification methylase
LLDDGRTVSFLGIQIDREEETHKYLQDYVLGKTVIIKDARESAANGLVAAYVYLKNKIFINTYLIKSGLASPDIQAEHRFAPKFLRLFIESKEYR